MGRTATRLFVTAAGIGAALIGAPLATAGARGDLRARTPEQEIAYFVLPDRFANGDTRNDRGGLKGGPVQAGYDPTSRAFYHGGDLKRRRAKLDYIQGLSATAIWLAAVFKNKPVQGVKAQESAGYHGCWVTDFTTVDPHFGTDKDFKALVDAAHQRGMKVYMDIIANHMANVIQYRKSPTSAAPYAVCATHP